VIGLVDWAAARARMVIAFIALSLLAGGFAYASLPKEGEPDIEIPAIFVSVPFPGISAADSETLLVKPMETELSSLDGLETMSSTASENYAGVALEFEFGWDKTQVLADVRDAMNAAEANFPAGAEQYSVNEINFSEFPVLIVNLTGDIPERTLLRLARRLQDRIESIDAVLEAGLAGQRAEMLEAVIDPLRLEACLMLIVAPLYRRSHDQHKTSVGCAAVSVTPSDTAKPGIAGRYMSIAKGPTADKRPRIRAM
jgi:multidrug efflux pump